MKEMEGRLLLDTNSCTVLHHFILRKRQNDAYRFDSPGLEGIRSACGVI